MSQLDHVRDALVMMIDDEPILMEVVKVMLEARGYRRFLMCEDSREALALVAEHKPDVILLDLVMPEVSGFDILAAVRGASTTAQMAVIVLTSSTDADTKLRALELGATDFLAKPVDESELALRLRNTLSAKAHQDRIANTDLLTGLPNRKHFVERLDDLPASDEPRHLLVFGVQDYKRVAESFGPSVGDEILRQLSARIRHQIPDDDCVEEPGLARPRDDEFAVVLSGWSRPQISRLGQELLRVCQAPFGIAEHMLHVVGAVGVTSVDAGAKGDVLLHRASIALRQAGDRSVGFYHADQEAAVRNRVKLETDLRHAVYRGELELHYQPKIDAKSGELAGLEALLRWRRDGELVSPADFIPVAEQDSTIVEIGAWVIEEACRTGAALERAGRGVPISVNVSARQITDGRLPEIISRALAVSGLRPDRLIAEITESVIMDDVEHSIGTLETIRALGVALSIDDFGTGYSSLNYLTRLPISELKIDQSFLGGVPDTASDVAIVKAVLALARSLSLSVTAEGVETEAQAEFLREHGCDRLQGYLFDRPMPLEELRARRFADIALGDARL